MEYKLKLFLLLIHISLSCSAKINCSSENRSFKKITNVNSCVVHQNPKIFNEFEEVEITGIQKDEIFEGFSAEDKDILYFPDEIGEKFPHLKALEIKYSKLKEISQENLKHFADLRHLDLIGNKIRFLEAELLQYNPQIAEVYIGNNEISAIEPNPFDIKLLTKLSIVGIKNNACIYLVYEGPEDFEKLGKDITKNCWSREKQIEKIDRNVQRNSRKSEYLDKTLKKTRQEIKKVENGLQKLNNDTNAIITSHASYMTMLNESIIESNKMVKTICNETIQKINQTQETVEKKLKGQDEKISNLASTFDKISGNIEAVNDEITEKLKTSENAMQKLFTNNRKTLEKEFDTKFKDTAESQSEMNKIMEEINTKVQSIQEKLNQFQNVNEIIQKIEESSEIKPQLIIQQTSTSSTSFIDYLNTALLVIITSIIIIMFCIQRQSKVTKNSQNNAIIRFDDVTSTYNDLNIRESSVPIPYQSSMDDNNYQYAEFNKIQRQTICDTQNVHNQIYEAPEGLKHMDEELYAEVVSPNNRPKTEVFNGTDDMALYAVVNKNR